MLTSLAAVLHITNIMFHAEGNADSAAVTDIDQLNIVADLLQVSNEELRLSLIQETSVTRGVSVSSVCVFVYNAFGHTCTQLCCVCIIYYIVF